MTMSPSASCLPDFNDPLEACPLNGATGDPVCVVDNIDGRGNIETNVANLDTYIARGAGWQGLIR